MGAFAVRDTVRALAASVSPAAAGAYPGALDAAIAWLVRTNDATGRNGSSKGFSLLHGWLPAYPETTGYVIGTLLEYGRRQGGRPDLIERAVQMGDWEKAVQEPDGGIMEGHVLTTPRRSVVFNTGMALHGWVDLIENGCPGYDEAAERAAGFLTKNLRSDGTWHSRFEYAGIAHTYNARVAWAMIRWARYAGDERVKDAARRQLDWTCSCQAVNGWFANCTFRPGTTPSTHAIAYTLRGLLESSRLVGEERWLGAVRRSAEALEPMIAGDGWLRANFHEDWRPASLHACLTGTVQMGGVWLRLHQETGERRWLFAGLKAVEQAAGRQERTHWPPVRGAIAGSFPVFGRYAPFQYPNWSTKFLADGLMVYRDCLDGTVSGGIASVTPAPVRRPGVSPVTPDARMS